MANKYVMRIDSNAEIKKAYTIRFDSSLAQWIKERAEQNLRSINSEVILLIQRGKEQVGA